MITHVCALGGNVLGAEGEGKTLTALTDHYVIRGWGMQEMGECMMYYCGRQTIDK